MHVLVVDHESTDGTPEIARARGAKVVVRPFEGFVNARRYALSQVLTPWTLMIDADEALDAHLRDALLSAPEEPPAYELSRTTYYCGRPLRMWSGERLVRLFRTEAVVLEAVPAAGGAAQLHERWVCPAGARPLNGTLLHYSYPTRRSYREKFEAYTSIEAQGLAGSRARWLRELCKMPARFLWYAFARGALLDGLDGLQVAWWSAAYPAVVQRKAMR